MAACSRSMSSKMIGLLWRVLREREPCIYSKHTCLFGSTIRWFSTTDDGSSSTDESPLKGFDRAVKRSTTRDPFPFFLIEHVQDILVRITGFDLDKINRTRQSPPAAPEYELLTDEMLKQKLTVAEAHGKERLHMPPFMKTREPIVQVLSRDADIAGLEKSKLVFTDITYGVSDRKREVVVRDVDGTLRKATWEERDKINQIYNPKPGCKIFTPKMFSPDNLERLLTERKYEYILDRACVQFEPDSAENIRVTHRTYEAVEAHHDYEYLWSTRHFGPMAFYLAWYRKIDHFLVDMLKRDKVTDGVDVVRLYHILHPDCQSVQDSQGITDDIEFLLIYAKTDALEGGQIELALQAYKSIRHKDTA